MPHCTWIPHHHTTSSDHGYHLGEFSMPIDKRQPYEFDIRVPFILRGPGIPANTSSEVGRSSLDSHNMSRS